MCTDVSCFVLISSTKELFLKFLERLEEDYNPKEYEGNLIKDVSTSSKLYFSSLIVQVSVILKRTVVGDIGERFATT